MGKLRVHELAKRLNLSNQEVIAKLNARGVSVRTHSSSVDEAAAFRALGLSKTGEASQEARPRTVLRRRKDQPEDSPGFEGSDDMSSSDALPEKVAVSEPVMEASEPHFEKPSTTSTPSESPKVSVET